MASHVVQTAIALLGAGASILIIGGFLRETLHDRGPGFHLFPDAHNRSESPGAKPDEPGAVQNRFETPAAKPDEPGAANDAEPFPHSRGKPARDRKKARNRNGKAREAAARQRREQRRSERRLSSRTERETASDHASAETEDL